MIQAARERVHRERAVKAVQGARCTACHRPVFRADNAHYYFWWRRYRVCAPCFIADWLGASDG